MAEFPTSSGPVFNEDHLINLYFLNELYQNIAAHVSQKISRDLNTEIPLTAGIWGGTYLIARPNGLSKRRIWRLYSMVNLPQNSPLDKQDNLERLIYEYSKAFEQAFEPYGLNLDLNNWGGVLPYSSEKKPSFTMHMTDSTETVRWLRAFFIWNQASWEESIIFDLVRILKEYMPYFDKDRGPSVEDPQEVKYLLQDIIIIYQTLKSACHEDFIEHAEPIIEELTSHFMLGLHDPRHIMDLYRTVWENLLIYGYEQTLEGPYAEAGLNIRQIDQWPIEKINWVPDALKETLIPPIQDLFKGFASNLALESSGK